MSFRICSQRETKSVTAMAVIAPPTVNFCGPKHTDPATAEPILGLRRRLAVSHNVAETITFLEGAHQSADDREL